MSRCRYRRAIGLEYGAKDDEVPRITLNGAADFADRIVKVAERFGVPVVRRPELARALSSFSISEYIPPRLYEAVAILIYEVERKFLSRFRR